MNPLIPLLLRGAIQVVTSKKAFKENITKPSTGLAAISAGVGALVITNYDSTESLVIAAISFAISAISFLYREYREDKAEDAKAGE